MTEKHDGTHEGNKDVPEEAAADGDTEQPEQPASDQAPEHADDNRLRQAEPDPFDKCIGQQPRQTTDNDPQHHLF